MGLAKSEEGARDVKHIRVPVVTIIDNHEPPRKFFNLILETLFDLVKQICQRQVTFSI